MNAEDAEREAKAKAAITQLTPEQREALLLWSSYDPCYDSHNNDWDIIGENGKVEYGHKSEREAEDAILMSMGIFDDGVISEYWTQWLERKINAERRRASRDHPSGGSTTQ